MQDAEIIINPSLVGMFPGVYSNPVSIKRFKNLQAVFDCIYNPFRTKLILEAKEPGPTCSDGLPMPVRQAVLAQNIWLDRTGDLSLTRKPVSLMRKKTSNLVLCGMPSSSRTTLGRLLSKRLCREFIDLDEHITEKQGSPPR